MKLFQSLSISSSISMDDYYKKLDLRIDEKMVELNMRNEKEWEVVIAVLF